MTVRGAVVLAFAVGLGLAQPLAAQDDAYDGLPPGEGQDLVYGTCTPCHSARLITQQGMTRERWDSTLTWMVESQGMPELPDDMRDDILDYLAEHFPADKRGGQPGMTRMPMPLLGR
jgi:hypothetical protein